MIINLNYKIGKFNAERVRKAINEIFYTNFGSENIVKIGAAIN